ncbi:hypothetical protein [Fictibacillus nanhaiensis]
MKERSDTMSGYKPILTSIDTVKSVIKRIDDFINLKSGVLEL